MQRLRLLGTNSSALRNSTISPEILLQSSSLYTPKSFGLECKPSPHQDSCAVIASASLTSSAGDCFGPSTSALWIPLDMFLEDCLDGTQVAASCAIDTLTSNALSEAPNTIFWFPYSFNIGILNKEKTPIGICLFLC